jgi:hypothetical protein
MDPMEKALEGDGAGGVQPEEPETIPADILPEEFRGRDLAEVKLILGQMPTIIHNQREELERVKNLGQPQSPAALGQEEEPVDLRELMEENPEAAMEHYISKRYGPQITAMEDRIGEGEISRFKSEHPNFAEYEEDVRTLLTASRQPATRENLHGAYAMAVGNRQILNSAQQRRAEAEAIKAAPPPGEEEKTRDLSPLEAEVAKALRMSPEDYVKYGAPDTDVSDLIGVK